MIPPALLPADGRFGSGPSLIRPAQLDALVDDSRLLGTSHRRLPVRNLVGEVRELLGVFFDLPSDYLVTLGNGGASAFWDIAVFSLIRERSAHAVSGEFGAKFAAEAAAAPFLADPLVVEAPAGQAASLSEVPDADTAHIDTAPLDTLALVHNETSTGVQIELKRPGRMGDDQLLIVDGTSIAGGCQADITQADVYFFAPQKCLGSDGGLWFAVLSPEALARVEQISATDRWIPEFLSLRAAVVNSRQNQTLNTPAIATLMLMRAQLRWLLDNGGAQFADARTRRSSGLLYDWAEASEFATPFVANPTWRSQVVVTIDFDPSVDAARLATRLRENGIVDVEPYRKLGRNQLRIATFPSIEPDDVRALIACLEYLVADGE